MNRNFNIRIFDYLNNFRDSNTANRIRILIFIFEYSTTGVMLIANTFVTLCAVELALKPSLNDKLVPAHARQMDSSSSNSADAGVPSDEVSGAAAGPDSARWRQSGYF